jgi:hypothetical protein
LGWRLLPRAGRNQPAAPKALSAAQYERLIREAKARIADDPLDVAVHARGKTVNDVAVELGCEPLIPLVIEAAASRERPLVVLVDALDEALDPRALAREALRPLTASGTVRLLVGTRHRVIAALALVDASANPADYGKG